MRHFLILKATSEGGVIIVILKTGTLRVRDRKSLAQGARAESI